MKVEKIIFGLIIFVLLFFVLVWAVDTIWNVSFGLVIRESDPNLVNGILILIFIASVVVTGVILEKLDIN